MNFEARSVAQDLIVQARHSVFDVEPNETAADKTGKGHVLTEADAVEIWIARWLRIRRKDLMARHGCCSSRLYEIWWGKRFPASREKAAKLFRERHPGLVERTSFGYRRIPRIAPPAAGVQADLFS